jgi:hypothetical protein
VNTSSADDDRMARAEAFIEEKRKVMGSWVGFEKATELFRGICEGDEDAEPCEPTEAVWEGAVWGVLLPLRY